MQARCLPSEELSGQARRYGRKGATKHSNSVGHKDRMHSHDGAHSPALYLGPPRGIHGLDIAVPKRGRAEHRC